MAEESAYDRLIAEQKQEEMVAWKQALDRDVAFAKRRAYLKIVEQCETTRIRKLIRANEFSTIPHLEKYKDQFSEPKDSKNKTDYYFVTVNPGPSVSLMELTDKVDKYTNRKIVTAAEWAYEQRSPDLITSGSGMHTHMIVQKPSEMRDKYFQDQTRESFKTLVGNPKTHVDIRPIQSEWVEDKRSYLKDVKTGEGKAEKQFIDKRWRLDNNLDDYYETSNKIKCLANPISMELELEKDDRL